VGRLTEWLQPQTRCAIDLTMACTDIQKRINSTKQKKNKKKHRPDHPAHGVVTLRTVQCRPAAACARKSPLRVRSKETRQDKLSETMHSVLGVFFGSGEEEPTTNQDRAGGHVFVFAARACLQT